MLKKHFFQEISEYYFINILRDICPDENNMSLNITLKKAKLFCVDHLSHTGDLMLWDDVRRHSVSVVRCIIISSITTESFFQILHVVRFGKGDKNL